MKETSQNFKAFVGDDLPLVVNYVGESFCDETFYFKRNKASEYALEYIVSGIGTLNINGQTVYPKKDDIFFLSKNSKHDYYCSSENPWHKIFITFNGDLADQLVKGYLTENVHIYDGTGLGNIFLNIYKISVNETYDYNERHDRILVELMKIFISIKSNGNIKALDLPDTIKKLLDMNLQKPYTITQLSEHLNYTDNHIINVFQQKFGKTPYQYFMQRKLELAKEYLETSQLSVAEIAEQLCYADPQYFATCFKKATGFTPSQYRKQKVEFL